VPVKAFEEIPVYGGIDYRREVLVEVANQERRKRRSLLQVLDEFGVGLKTSFLRLLKFREEGPSVNILEEV
jgi:hypothetical protein